MKRIDDLDNSMINTGHVQFIMGDDKKDEAYKDYRRRWDEDPINHVVGKAPINLDLELNSTCNLRCVMCYYSYSPPKPSIMDFDVAKRLIKEAADIGVCSIKYQLRGDPLLYERLPELVEYAKECGIIETLFNTNGALLTAEKASLLVQAGLDKIIITFDGLEAKIYEKIRKGAKFEKVKNNILNLMSIKKYFKSETPTVRIQMINLLENTGRIDEFIEVWKDVVDEVGMNDYLKFDYINEGLPLRNWSCGQLWQRIIICADGDVIPCCGGFHFGNKKYEVLGNIHKDSINEIWHGKKLNRLRLLHKKGNSHEVKMCRLCGQREWVVKNVPEAH